MAKFADDYQTPILAALATHPDITKNNGFISQLCFDDNTQGKVAALFVRDELLIDKVAVFNDPGDRYSRYLAAKFKEKFVSIGGEITDTVSMTEVNDDLSKTIQSVYVRNPELLYLPLFVSDVLRIIKEVRKLGWNPLLMGSDGLISNMLAAHKEDLDFVEGMMAVDVFAHGIPLTSFGKKAKEEYGGRDRPSIFAGLGAEGYAVLLNAINPCSDSADRTCINQQIRSTNNFQGLAGNITIGPDGKARRSLCINSIQGGRSRFIVKVY